jgi:hypothetical protein
VRESETRSPKRIPSDSAPNAASTERTAFANGVVTGAGRVSSGRSWPAREFAGSALAEPAAPGSFGTSVIVRSSTLRRG